MSKDAAYLRGPGRMHPNPAHTNPSSPTLPQVQPLGSQSTDGFQDFLCGGRVRLRNGGLYDEGQCNGRNLRGLS